jgi:hypothetical protein
VGDDILSLDPVSELSLLSPTFEIEILMKNPFEHYGIEHLSPSSCTLFVASPAMFILQKLMKVKTAVGPAAHRGTAVESGIVAGLVQGLSEAECINVAREQFSTLTTFASGSKKDKEEEAIADFVKTGLRELMPYGKPTSTQGKIHYEFDGLLVPMLGYYDIEWADHGILTDIKTTHALPAKISTSHARQVALYRASRGDNLDARVSYITPKKSATYSLENARDHLASLRMTALTIQRFLSLSDDPKVLASYVVPNVDTFYFSDPVARKATYDLWGV